MSFTNVLEGGFAIKFLPAFVELEGLVTVIFPRITLIINIARYFQFYAAKSIDDFLKAIKIKNEGVVEWLTSDSRNSLFDKGSALILRETVLVERIDFTSEIMMAIYMYPKIMLSERLRKVIFSDAVILIV